MNNILKKFENVALTNFDILKLLNEKANIVLYPELHQFTNLDQILGPYGVCVLLFEIIPKYGHWVCIFQSIWWFVQRISR